MNVFRDFEDFTVQLPKATALVGLDLGTKTIGVSVSDLLWTVATPRETIKRTKLTQDWVALEGILSAVSAGGLVLGLPYNMDGSEGPRVQSTLAFARNIAAKTDLPIGFWDERLSSVAAERAMLEADMSRAKRAEVIDHVAASYILQGALDGLRHLG